MLFRSTLGGGTPACGAQANTTRVSIPDAGTAITSPVTVAGCTANASDATMVEVHITHSYRGDLVIDLLAPDGTSYRLKSSSGNDSADNVNQTFKVNASTEVANGVWRLQVRDVFSQDVGTLDSWKLSAQLPKPSYWAADGLLPGSGQVGGSREAFGGSTEPGTRGCLAGDPRVPGSLVLLSDEGDGMPAFWLSDEPVGLELWSQLRAGHSRSGFWPLLLVSADDEGRPWATGEVWLDGSSPTDHDRRPC